MQGAFLVSPDPNDPRGILFQLAPKLEEPVPEDQADLQDRVARTLAVLDRLYPERDDARFTDAHRSLLSLARVGLVGDSAQPVLARRALATFRAHVVDSEAGRVKNRYMRSLGRASLLSLVVSLALAYVAASFPQLTPLPTLLFLWAGCSGGVWLSFGARKISLEFEELADVEQDRLEPLMRILFAGGLTMVLGLLFVTGATELAIGNLSTAHLSDGPAVPILFGALAGLSEQALSHNVLQKGASMFGGDAKAAGAGK